ncbi:MAG: NB-ARC domain-containing protein [Pseudomonadota bacterium]
MAKQSDWPLHGIFFLDSLLRAKESDPKNKVVWDNQRIALEILNVAPSTLNRWCSGETPIPEAKFKLAVSVIVAARQGTIPVQDTVRQFKEAYSFLECFENAKNEPQQTIPDWAAEFLIRRGRLTKGDPHIACNIKPPIADGDRMQAESPARPRDRSQVGIKPNPPCARLSNLPYRLPDFTGQQEQMDLVRRSLTEGQDALLAGMGGIGKTTLAVEFAHQHFADFPGGVFFADAQGMSRDPLQPVEVARLLAQAIDPIVQPRKDKDWTDVLEAHLASRRSLLVLDNLWSAETMRALRMPGSTRVLATARRRLGVPGCHIIDVDELSLADAVSLLRKILHPLSFDESSLRELAGECGALPLALRAAATFMLVYKLPIKEYIRRLRIQRSEQSGQRLSYLSEARELDKALDVQAVLSLSLEKLLEVNRELALRYLDLVQFPADFDARAVSTIWDIDARSTEQALDRLVAQSLVQRDHASGRLRIHDLLKEMAESQLVA